MAQEAAKKAGDYLKSISGSEIKIKKRLNRDIKLMADIESESLIIDFLQKKSNFSILSEESGLVINTKSINSNCKWIVDPLDGSNNFIKKIDKCCVSIALWENSNPIIGVIFDFNRNELFSGLVSDGAWLNGKSIHTKNVKKNSDMILATGFPVSMDFTKESFSSLFETYKTHKKIRMIGSAALSLAYVACNRFDKYYEENIKIWDVAAGISILKAAGGNIKYKGYPKSNLVSVIGQG